MRLCHKTWQLSNTKDVLSHPSAPKSTFPYISTAPKEPFLSIPYPSLDSCCLLLNFRSSGMQRPAFARTEPYHGRINRRDEPEKHVHQINPNSVLHANLRSLLRRRVCRNEDLAKDAKERGPEDEEHPVPAEGPVGLEEGQAVDEDGEGAEAADDFSVDPFAVGVAAFFVRRVQVDGVQAADGYGEDELEEA